MKSKYFLVAFLFMFSSFSNATVDDLMEKEYERRAQYFPFFMAAMFSALYLDYFLSSDFTPSRPIPPAPESEKKLDADEPALP